MKESIFTLVEESSATIKPVLMEKLNRVLKEFGVPNKERKIKFTEFENPTVAAVICYDILCDLSKTDKSYFDFIMVVCDLYRNISRTIKSAQFAEKHELQNLKDRLANLTFNVDYYRNDFGFYLTSDGKFGGYIFDNSMGSPKTKVTMMIKAKQEFERFSLSERDSMEYEFNIPSKKQFEEDPFLKIQFMEAVGTHKLPELVKVAREYGYLPSEEVEQVNSVRTSSIFG